VSPEEALEDLMKRVEVDDEELKGVTDMKVVELRVPGTEREPLILEVSPGMRAGDLLAEADLAADCALVRACVPMHNLAREEGLYNLLTDCEILYAFFPTGE
jgi:hypothetical protein